MFCDFKGSITKKFNCKFKGVLKCFDLRPKDLREASINSMPLKSLVFDTNKYENRKTVKINKKSSIGSNNQES